MGAVELRAARVAQAGNRAGFLLMTQPGVASGVQWSAEPAGAAAPAQYRSQAVRWAFDALPQDQAVPQALSLARQIVSRHYENFSVVSLLLPQRLRQDFCNVYLFCRAADDLGDEAPSRDVARVDLARFRQLLIDCYNGQARSGVFVALRDTVERTGLPMQPLLDLVDAFEQDQSVNRYDNFAQLRDYCRRSADPVGRIVLHLCEAADEQNLQLSDFTCTALQLANFWQDVRRDFVDLDRIYLPRETMSRFGVDEQQLASDIAQGRCRPGFREAIAFEVRRARELFQRGEALLSRVPQDVRGQIALFGRGGLAVLDAIERRNFDTLTARPSLSVIAKARLIATAGLGALLGAMARRSRGHRA